MLAGEDERDLPSAELARNVAEERERIRVAQVVEVTARCEMHADTTRAPHRDEFIDHFEQQPRAVLDGTAVVIGAAIGALVKELIDQVAICAMELDAIEAGLLCVLRAAMKGPDHTGDLTALQRSRHDVRRLRPHQAHVPGRCDCAWGHRRLPVQKYRM